MRIVDLPVVAAVVDAGPDDRVFDGLLLAGPFVILLIVLVGETILTSALAGGYVAAIVAYVCYLAVTTE